MLFRSWDRAVIMKDGKIHADISKEEMETKEKSLEDMFFEITENDSGID